MNESRDYSLFLDRELDAELEAHRTVLRAATDRSDALMEEVDALTRTKRGARAAMREVRLEQARRRDQQKERTTPSATEEGADES